MEAPISCLDFLNDWPVGLKLNTPLSQFFCSSATLLIQHWNELVTPLLQTHGPLLLTVIANSALLGLTLLLSIVSDALSVLALHIRLSHAAASFVFSLQRDSLSGLFNLFRGKRWNVLRQRTDSYQYDIDQLFLGTVLFTVSIFLMPTTTSYAGFFAAIHLALWAIQKTIERAVQALNAFPLFEVMLRIKEPSRLPCECFVRSTLLLLTRSKPVYTSRSSTVHHQVESVRQEKLRRLYMYCACMCVHVLLLGPD